MREVPSSAARAHFSKLLGEVERGTTIVITRHGRAIARLEPTSAGSWNDVQRTMDEIALFRRTMTGLSLGDVLTSRHESHRA